MVSHLPTGMILQVGGCSFTSHNLPRGARQDDGALRADGCLSATADAWTTGISRFGCEWRGCGGNSANFEKR